MNTYFKRPSVKAALIGLVLAVLAFIPALFPVFNWERPQRDAIAGGLLALIILWFAPILTTFFQQLEIEEKLKDEIVLSNSSCTTELAQLRQAVEALATITEKTRTELSSTSEAVNKILPFAKLQGKAPELAGTLAKAAWQLHATAEAHGKEPRIMNHAHLIVADCVTRATELRAGRFKTPFWSCRILTEEVKNMTNYLLGYSPLFEEDEVRWWQTGIGQAFFATNVDVLKHGRDITRIFCVDSESDAVRALFHQHHTVGIKVVVVQRVDVKHLLDEEESAAIVDGKLAYVSATDPDGRAWNLWTYNPDDLRERQERLNVLLSKGRVYTPSAS